MNQTLYLLAKEVVSDVGWKECVLSRRGKTPSWAFASEGQKETKWSRLPLQIILMFILDRFLTLDNVLTYKKPFSFNMDRTNVSITPIAGWMHFLGAEKSFWQIIVNCNQVQHLPWFISWCGVAGWASNASFAWQSANFHGIAVSSLVFILFVLLLWA